METPKETRTRLKKFSKKLNGKLAKSERWFWKNYNKFKHVDDIMNCPFQNKFIPDVCNHRYKYVVEVDGSFHNRPDQIKKDKIKDEYYSQHGYRRFRIIAHDNDSFNQFIYELYKLRDIPFLRKVLTNNR
jgi:very-short-patch-repair endonuclease